ncbi:hypothetical protein Tco_0532085 [Tanacetum coccineum]
MVGQKISESEDIIDTTTAQQITLDDALVAPSNRLKIGNCNHRLSSTLKSNKPTLQVVLDVMKLTPFYKAFQITANVPEIYMQEFWATVSIHHTSLSFKMNDKSHTLNLENFRYMLQICPRLLGRKFKDPLLEEEILSFIRELGVSGKTTGSRAQIIWGMCHKKNVDYVYLIWEDLVYQVENKKSKKNNDMCYPRFTKVIIDYSMSKDQSISRRNKMFWHIARDDPMFNTIRVIYRHQDTHIYGAILPDELTNQEMLDSKAYKEYYDVASGAEPPKAKTKYKKKANEPVTSSKKKTAPTSKGSRLKSPAKVAKTDKKKQPATMPKTKGLDVLSEVALTEAEQIKLATKRSKKDFHMSHTSGSGDGVDIQSKVLDEQQQKVTDTNEGAGVRPEVPDVPKYISESEKESWTFSQDDKDNVEDSDMNDDNEETESDNDGDNLTHPNLSTYKADDQEEEEKADDEEVSSDQRVSTPPNYELTDEEENKEGDDKDKEGEQEQDDEDDLYGDVNISLERSDAEMTDAQANKDIEDSHVTLIAEPPVVQQQSCSISSDLVSKFINPSLDTDSTTTTTILTTTMPDIPNFASLFQFKQRVSAMETEMSELKQTNQFTEVVSSILVIVDNYLASKMKDAVNVVVQLQTNKLREDAQAENHEIFNQVDSTMKAIIKEQVQAQVSKIMPKIEKYVTESLGAKVLVRSTNQPQTSYANLYNALVKSYNSDKDIISSYGDVVTLKRGQDDQDKDEDPSAGSNRGSKRRRSGKEAESSKELTHKESKSTSSSKGATRSQPKSSGKYAHAEEHGQKVDDLEDQSHQEFNTGNNDETSAREALDDDESQWNPSSSPTPDREWYKTKTVDNRPPQPWITQMAQVVGTQSSFNEFLATPIDFFAFIMHRPKINNLTQEVLTGPTCDLIKGMWKPYPYDLSKPLLLILNERGRQVIPLDHFINNNLEYLKGGSSIQKYTTSITKTKAVDYGQVKWIEDKVSRIWSPVKVVYDKHAYWGTYHWGPKRQKFYRYATNMESSKDVYSRHRIIAVTSLKIMQFFGYNHLEEIIVRRQDDQLYNFREDLKRMNPYTAYPDIQGIIYEDEMNRNRLMRTDELHKFSDGTLNHVHTALNDIAIGLKMDYLPKRK